MVIGYGVALPPRPFSIYPNTTEPQVLFRGILKRAYFKMFGELFLVEVDGKVKRVIYTGVPKKRYGRLSVFCKLKMS